MRTMQHSENTELRTQTPIFLDKGGEALHTSTWEKLEMKTIAAIAALAVVFPLVFRLAHKLGDWTKIVSILKRIHAL